MHRATVSVWKKGYKNLIKLDSIAYVDDSYSFFSLLNITGKAKGITIKNAKYLLNNAEIGCSYQYGISNEVLPGRTAEIKVDEGKLLLVKIR